MFIDLHVHTTLSPCSQLELDTIVSKAREKGLDGVCITDHDTMAARHSLREGIQDNGLRIIYGMEYTTALGDFLIFGPFEDLPSGLPARLLLRHVEESGGVAVAAHPFRARRSANQTLIEDKLCSLVEGVNGRNSREENVMTTELQEKFGVRMVAGSDAHTLDELGKTPTAFTTPIHSRADLIAALRSGAFRQAQPCPAYTTSIPKFPGTTTSQILTAVGNPA